MPTGRELAIDWRGHPARAWLPAPLTERDLGLSVATARRTEQAAAAVRRVRDRLPPDWEPLARLLLRSEGVASSYIEGVQAPAELVAAAEVDPTVDVTAAAIAANLVVARAALDAAVARPLDVGDLHAWHGRLMADDPRLDPDMIGAFRRTQSWIGGSSPLDAAFVPPSAEHIDALVDDLVAFANRDELDPVTQAAAVHGQFETIHPYGDGNGRVGRLLIGWVLARRTGVLVPPPVSVAVARDPGGYLSGLHFFTHGPLERFVAWFADVVEAAASASVDLVDTIGAVMSDWRGRLAGLRSDTVVHKILDLLPTRPVISAPLAAAELPISERSARQGLAVLAARGVLEPLELASAGRGRPRRWWVAPALLSPLRV